MPALFPWFCLAGALLAGLLLLPGLGGGFIFDDKASIQDNVSIHLDKPNAEDVLYAAYSFQPGNGSRPLSMLSFALDYWRGGMDARVFKSTNILIHMLTVLALGLLLRRLLALAQWPPRRAALGAALLATVWAIHPLQVSSVLYVVQRMQTLVTLFMVLALWAYLGMRQAQMEGSRSRLQGVLTVLFWVLGFAAKEDALLLPLYTLALELTVLRFRATQPLLTAVLRRGYLGLTVLGTLAWLLVIVPHYWSWAPYGWRDFNTWERLLSQGRVLVMYLGQMLWPLPSRLPFYYDNFAVSRSLLQPVTTLPAWLLLAALLVWAWCWRTRRPLFAFGVMLFFAGHFMTSNVIPLELVFEHRNHLPLIGIVLALGDLAMAAWQQWHLPRWLGLALLVLVIAGEGAVTVLRAYAWGEPLRFAKASLRWAPDSERAWGTLNAVYADRSGLKPKSPYLGLAIEACEQGAAVTGSPMLLSNVVVYKTIRGDVGPEDWERFLARYRTATMGAQTRAIVWTFLRNADGKWPQDAHGVLRTIEIANQRIEFTANENLQLAAYIHNHTDQPDKALPFLKRAVELSPKGDPDIEKLFAELPGVGREDWLVQLRQIKRQPARR